MNQQLESLCGVRAMYMRIPNSQCMVTHIMLHAAGPSGSMTPPAIPLAAPSTPRTQPQPSTSAAAASRNQPATTSQVVLAVPLLELRQLSCCLPSCLFTVLQYHQHCLSVFEFQLCPAAEAVQHAITPVERSLWSRSASVGCSLMQPGRQTCCC